MNTALPLLFGRVRAAVLQALHHAPNETVHLRELARRARASPTATQYELRLLSQLDMVRDTGTLARPLYQLNREHPLYSDLRAMFTRGETTTDLPDDAHFTRKRVLQQQARRTRSRRNAAILRHWKDLPDRVKVA